jgi:hypothetical protein
MTALDLFLASIADFEGCPLSVFPGYLSKEKGGKTVKQR